MPPSQGDQVFHHLAGETKTDHVLDEKEELSTSESDEESACSDEESARSGEEYMSPSSSYEEMSNYDDSDGEEFVNALSLACLNKSSAPVLRAVLSCSDDAMKVEKDSDGNTPLHHAILLFSDEERALMMIEACPKATFIPDNQGWLSLHLAIVWVQSASVIRALIKANSSAVMEVNEDDDTPLDIFFRQWDLQLRKLMECGGDIDSDSLLEKDLQHVYSNNFKKVKWIYEVTILLLEAVMKHTVAENIPYEEPFDPLRAAIIIDGCPWSFFHLILRIHPEKAVFLDSHRNSLLHTLTSTHPSSDGELFECSSCERVFFGISWYQHVRESHTKYCERCFSDVLDHHKSDFNLEHPVFKVPAVLSDLQKVTPEIASYPDQNGRLPLSLTIEQDKRCRAKNTGSIFDSCPSAIFTRDIQTHLYPFLLAAVGDTEEEKIRLCKGEEDYQNQFNLCYKLLMDCPNLVHIGIPDKGIKRKKN